MADDNIRIIPITQSFSCTVDLSDFEHLSRFSWYAVKTKRIVYAARKVRGIHFFMHHAIMGKHEGLRVDHADGDGLNNRRSNLRVITNRQNIRHTKTVRGAVPFRGVYKAHGKFKSEMVIDGSIYRFGVWTVPEDAARAWDEGLLKHGNGFGFPNYEDALTFDYATWRKEALARKED